MTVIDKIKNSNALIDTVANKITFLDSRFYELNGNFYPSVTTILEAYPKGYEYLQWIKKMGEDSDTIRDEAGRRGSVVHDLTEKLDSGKTISLYNENGWQDYHSREWAMIEKYVEFRRRFPLEIIHSEQNYVSEKLGFAGTIDRVVRLLGQTILIDIKTSNAIYPSYWLQLAAYEKLITDAYGYNPVDTVGILWLNAKTRTDGKKGDIQGVGWQLVLRNNDNSDTDWERFEATHKIWLAENSPYKPKQTTYSLTHKK